MRLDKFLKASGLVKRRPVAKKLCDAGRVLLGDRPAKAATEVGPGDLLEIRFGNRAVVVEVAAVADKPVGKDEQRALYEIKQETRIA